MSIKDDNAFMDYKDSYSCPTFEFTFVLLVSNSDLENYSQCLWRPYGVVVQVMDFETPQMFTTY